MTTRADIIAYARTLLGTPYRHQGRLPGVGLDCVGVLVAVATHFGLSFHDCPAYARVPHRDTLERELEAGGMAEVPRSRVRPGDAMTFWVRTRGVAKHAMLLTDRGVLHAYHSVNPVGVVETALEPFWAHRLSKCYRFPGTGEEG
jgi:NlpC/P60 family putative phage cell wall peptidase